MVPYGVHVWRSADNIVRINHLPNSILQEALLINALFLQTMSNRGDMVVSLFFYLWLILVTLILKSPGLNCHTTLMITIVLCFKLIIDVYYRLHRKTLHQATTAHRLNLKLRIRYWIIYHNYIPS